MVAALRWAHASSVPSPCAEIARVRRTSPHPFAAVNTPTADELSGFTITVRNRADGVAVDVVVAGALDRASASVLEDRLMKIVRVRQPSTLSLDVGGVQGVDHLLPICPVVASAIGAVGGQLIVIDGGR